MQFPDDHTFHDMDLDLYNPAPHESFNSYFPDVYDNRYSPASEPTFSLSTSSADGEKDLGIQNANNAFQTSNRLLEGRELYEGSGVDQQDLDQSLPIVKFTTKPRSLSMTVYPQNDFIILELISDHTSEIENQEPNL
ncbi:hypothetical protein PtA15_5A731 [Puccinia triticina]|uniref:Uncharacterized protein n=1 Tax=Puccinia triticina TaxID=208348 RepID=A0ABY7CMF7_9BASI|nr:uncharacterized protein PtA15_5A731 [Puccinia triticina]WAQ85157.1 hypothetical protein PtA15_5A731 [Puccinia triticina]WAR58498.1 hypothetical protein PtB15_5B732 [Puccinia triticina]